MIRLDIPHVRGEPLRVLCLGAHCDDIEIGCGGTLLSLLGRYREVDVWWYVFSSNAERKREAEAGARAFLQGAGKRHIVIEEFRESFFPYQGADIKLDFEQLKCQVNPDLIFTHYRDDRHQDHRVISDLTWNTFRDNLILEYEILKYDGDLGSPNMYSALTLMQYQRKIDLLIEHFSSQHQKTWFDKEAFAAMLRIRGVECNAPEGYAEAFYCRKLCL